MYLLDTNVLSEVIRPSPDGRLAAALRTKRTADLFASAVTYYEMRYGACLRKNIERFWTRIQQDVLPLVNWLAMTPAIAHRGGEVAAALMRKGRGAGELDPLLAATALEHDLILITRNVRHFEPIPGLRIENWFAGD